MRKREGLIVVLSIFCISFLILRQTNYEDETSLHLKITELQSSIANRASFGSTSCDCDSDSSAIESRLHEVENTNKQLKSVIKDLYQQLTTQCSNGRALWEAVQESHSIIHETVESYNISELGAESTQQVPSDSSPLVPTNVIEKSHVQSPVKENYVGSESTKQVPPDSSPLVPTNVIEKSHVQSPVKENYVGSESTKHIAPNSSPLVPTNVVEKSHVQSPVKENYVGSESTKHIAPNSSPLVPTNVIEKSHVQSPVPEENKPDNEQSKLLKHNSSLFTTQSQDLVDGEIKEVEKQADRESKKTLIVSKTGSQLDSNLLNNEKETVSTKLDSLDLTLDDDRVPAYDVRAIKQHCSLSNETTFRVILELEAKLNASVAARNRLETEAYLLAESFSRSHDQLSILRKALLEARQQQQQPIVSSTSYSQACSLAASLNGSQLLRLSRKTVSKLPIWSQLGLDVLPSNYTAKFRSTPCWYPTHDNQRRPLACLPSYHLIGPSQEAAQLLRTLLSLHPDVIASDSYTSSSCEDVTDWWRGFNGTLVDSYLPRYANESKSVQRAFNLNNHRRTFGECSPRMFSDISSFSPRDIVGSASFTSIEQIPRPFVPELILSVTPNVKFIALLHNPAKSVLFSLVERHIASIVAGGGAIDQGISDRLNRAAVARVHKFEDCLAFQVSNQQQFWTSRSIALTSSPPQAVQASSSSSSTSLSTNSGASTLVEEGTTQQTPPSLLDAASLGWNNPHVVLQCALPKLAKVKGVLKLDDTWLGVGMYARYYDVWKSISGQRLLVLKAEDLLIAHEDILSKIGLNNDDTSKELVKDVLRKVLLHIDLPIKTNQLNAMLSSFYTQEHIDKKAIPLKGGSSSTTAQVMQKYGGAALTTLNKFYHQHNKELACVSNNPSFEDWNEFNLS